MTYDLLDERFENRKYNLCETCGKEVLAPYTQHPECRIVEMNIRGFRPRPQYQPPPAWWFVTMTMALAAALMVISYLGMHS